MKNRSGIENSVLWREARPDFAPAAAASGSGPLPPAACTAEAITIFWFGQITNHTLYHMAMPKAAPVRIVTPQEVENIPQPFKWPLVPRISRPVTIVHM